MIDKRMKKIGLLLVPMALALSACQNGEKQAGQLFQRAEAAYAAGEYSLAKLPVPSERAIILSFSYVYLSFYAGKNTTIFGTPPHIPAFFHAFSMFPSPETYVLRKGNLRFGLEKHRVRTSET
jgi:hypothetical protein